MKTILPSITNGSYLPLQSVKEDKRLQFNDHLKYSQKYSIPVSSTPLMSRTNSFHHHHHQRSSPLSSKDDDTTIENINNFSRNQRMRSSLPFVIKPAINTPKLSSLGICFLICGNETRKVALPSYISCLDTLKALFVRAFPQQLTMKQMDSDHLRIYIREQDRDIFYQLEEISDVKDRSVLKVVQLNVNHDKPHVSFQDSEIDQYSEKKETLSPLSVSQIDKDDSQFNTKVTLMEKQLESLTELVRDLTNPTKPKISINFDHKYFHKQLYELKLKTNALRNDLLSIRRMQQTLQEDLKMEIQQANKNIREQVLKLNQNKMNHQIEKQFHLYVNQRRKIDQELEDLEISVEQLQNDVKSKQCYVTMNDVECFALVLSTISRSLVDLKATFPILREKLSSYNHQNTFKKFLSEEPEHLDYTIKKCKRLTTMLFQLKQLTMNDERKSIRKISIHIHDSLNDKRKNLIEEIQSITWNSEERMKSIEKLEKLRQRRLIYEDQLEHLKRNKSNYDKRKSVCSIDSNNYSSCSPSSYASFKPQTKVTFSQQLINNDKSLKSKQILPIRIPSTTSSSSAISSASLSSSSSTDADIIASNSYYKSTKDMKLMRASVTDL